MGDGVSSGFLPWISSRKGALAVKGTLFGNIEPVLMEAVTSLGDSVFDNLGAGCTNTHSTPLQQT